jgi:REP element-mobilizing transposase RayT
VRSGQWPTVREGVLCHGTFTHGTMRDFDDNEFPLAYLITFRCYGTWVHGDTRGSMDRKQNVYGTAKLAANAHLERSDSSQRKHPPIVLDAGQRKVVEGAVKRVCEHRKYLLRAINVRTNHAHSVVSAMQKPEPLLDAFKSYSTRALRRAGLLSPAVKPWARHGSTIYLWKERDVAKAIEYVMLGQGDELFRLDD